MFWISFFMDYDKLEWQVGLEWRKGVSTFCQYMCEVGSFYFPPYSTTVTALTFALTCILRIGVVSSATCDMKNHFDSQWSKRGKKKERKKKKTTLLANHLAAEKFLLLSCQKTFWISKILMNWQEILKNEICIPVPHKRPGILILPIFYECNL